MTSEQRAALEESLQQAHEAGDFDRAATLAMEGYGPEILGFVMSLMNGEEEPGREIFSMFCEDLWRGIEGFSWASSFRTWAYTLARNARSRYLRAPRLRREKRLLTGEAQKLEHRVRDATLPYLKTEMKQGVAALREKLDPEDRELLVLRVDRAMSWKDIAEIMASESMDDTAALKKKAAALRKRFSRLKDVLREEAIAAGLLGKS